VPTPADNDVHMRFSPEEIKAALAAKLNTEASGSSSPSDPKAATPADSQIAGDEIPPAASPVSAAASKSGTIPDSDPAPACANLKDTTSVAAACPAAPSPSASAPYASADPDAQPEKRRKPPTLYEPAPPQ